MEHVKLLCSFYLFLLCFSYVTQSTSLPTKLIDHQTHARTGSSIRYTGDFIFHLCQRSKQYPRKIKKQFCSEQWQDEHQQQQRDKRVGWTITI